MFLRAARCAWVKVGEICFLKLGRCFEKVMSSEFSVQVGLTIVASWVVTMINPG